MGLGGGCGVDGAWREHVRGGGGGGQLNTT